MKTIKIAFYKNSKTFFGKLIKLKQNIFLPKRYARYSHTEIVFESGFCFSSSEVDGGTRFKKIDFKKKNWDFIFLEVTNKEYKKIKNFCNKENGQAYNWFGIFFAQIFNFNFKKKGDWFCSEICTRVIQEAGFLPGVFSLFTNPGELAKKLEGEGFLLNSLK